MTAQNVFADLKCDQPAALLLKAQLMVAVLDHVKLNGWGANAISPARSALLQQHDFNAFPLEEMVEIAAQLEIRLQIAQRP
ncbi:hypothetical protein [Pseudomonas sp. O230]|uniref:hypothetical protein n=1 Tax=Pseudomonas sp. O230 TaxID=3159450 RepID=UPI00387AC483